jgi:hypothetical protein
VDPLDEAKAGGPGSSVATNRMHLSVVGEAEGDQQATIATNIDGAGHLV